MALTQALPEKLRRYPELNLVELKRRVPTPREDEAAWKRAHPHTGGGNSHEHAPKDKPSPEWEALELMESELPVDVLLLWREEANVQLYRRDQERAAAEEAAAARKEALRVEKKLNKKRSGGWFGFRRSKSKSGDGNDDGDDGSRAVAVAKDKDKGTST